ncbi:MAG TPA: GNAT family N-acetyltransferase [Clostridia bacterium]
MGFEDSFSSFPVIETERLILRNIKPEDEKRIFMHFSDADVIRYLDVRHMKDMTEASEFINKSIKAFNNQEMIQWAVTLKGDDTFIGRCYCHEFFMKSRSLMGYDLSRNYWGMGIGKEVVKAVMKFCFHEMGLHRLQALVYPQNIPSINLLQKLEFVNEGLLREFDYHFGEKNFKDVYMFACLKSQYDS